MFKWRRLLEQGAQASLKANEPTVAESEVKELKVRVRELERLGRKTMEWQTPLPVDKGEHTVVVTASGAKRREIIIDVPSASRPVRSC
jgi:transposase-like protein